MQWYAPSWKKGSLDTAIPKHLSRTVESSSHRSSAAGSAGVMRIPNAIKKPITCRSMPRRNGTMGKSWNWCFDT